MGRTLTGGGWRPGAGMQLTKAHPAALGRSQDLGTDSHTLGPCHLVPGSIRKRVPQGSLGEGMLIQLLSVCLSDLSVPEADLFIYLVPGP